MATYVLVHGAAHGGWCYQRVAKLLRAAWHEVYAPTLTGLGERAHLISASVDLECHITDIVNVLEFEDLRDVILVGHSYGGIVITGAADRARGRVGHLVYLDAVTPVNGESLADFFGGFDEVRASSRVVDGVELVLFPGTGPLPTYGLTDPDDIAWLTERITPHPWNSIEQPLALSSDDAVAGIPQSQIVATPELAHLYPERIEPAVAAGRIWYIETGHDLMISEPQAVADALLTLSADLTQAVR